VGREWRKREEKWKERERRSQRVGTGVLEGRRRKREGPKGNCEDEREEIRMGRAGKGKCEDSTFGSGACRAPSYATDCVVRGRCTWTKTEHKVVCLG
jgi:hypothetical protein